LSQQVPSAASTQRSWAKTARRCSTYSSAASSRPYCGSAHRAPQRAPAADGGQQRDAPFDRDQPGGCACGEHGGGQVDQLAVLAPRAGGDHHGAARAEQGGAAGEDAGEPVEQAGPVAVGQVPRVGVVAVPVGGLDHAGRGGADQPVHGGPVRRGGHHERDPAAQGGRDQVEKSGGVAADDHPAAGRALGASQGKVGGGDVGPSALELDADGVPAEVGGLEQGGADPAHWVEHEVAGVV
jgi:hypothetical protein